MREQNLNMTQGNPVRLLVVFSIPMLIGNIFQQLYNLADSMIVGKTLGPNPFAAIGITGSVTFLFFALCNGLGSGGGIITSQYFGSGDIKAVKSCIANTAYIMLVFPTIVGIVAFFMTEPLLQLLETNEVLMPDAVAYMRVMCIGLVFVSVYNFVSSMMRALGDSKTPLYCLVVSCFINIILDLVFILVFHWGVVGAGVATVISQMISGLVCLVIAVLKNPYFKLSKEDLRYNPIMVKKAIRLGVPLSLQFSLIAISCMALQRVVNTFGPVAAAAFTATSRIEQLIHQPYQTLGAALSTYSGQNYGAMKTNRLIEGYHKSLIMMTIFTAAMMPFMQFFGKAITALFVDDPEVIEMGAKALQISSWFYIFLGIIYVVRGVLNGVGDAFFALLNGIVEVVGRFVVPIALTGISAIGLWGIWWSVGVVWFFSGFTAWLRYLVVKKRF